MTDRTDGTNGDVGGNMSGDETAWRELIAQYELPAASDTAAPPWPEREDLGNSPRDPSAQAAGQSAPADPGPPGEEDSSGPDGTPGASTPGASTPDASPPGTSTPDASPPGTSTPGADADANGRRAPGAAGDRTRVVRPASPVWRPATDAAEEEDDRYVPPPPPPLPSLDPVAKGAWAALFGGPAYLLLATLLAWQVSGWAALAAVTAFVGGFAVIIFRMGDGPSRGDGPDNGAVV